MTNNTNTKKSNSLCLIAMLTAPVILSSDVSAAFCSTSNSAAMAQAAGNMARLPQHLSNNKSSSGSRSFLNMYAPHQSISQTPALSSLHAARVMTAADRHESSTASSDTLPQFKTSHGLLSPRTVLRLEQNYKSVGGSGDVMSDELSYFLDTYKEFGPMACLPMLSDARILPELTKAMRESISD